MIIAELHERLGWQPTVDAKFLRVGKRTHVILARAEDQALYRRTCCSPELLAIERPPRFVAIVKARCSTSVTGLHKVGDAPRWIFREVRNMEC
jgi:hypothetical protein